MSQEIARWLIALGAVATSVGGTIVGMAMSYVQSDDGMITIGLVLTVAGVVAMAIGGYVYLFRPPEEPGPTAARRSSDQG
jgi:predicted membrane channel-forming protein YqfA (hemolysin III family)